MIIACYYTWKSIDGSERREWEAFDTESECEAWKAKKEDELRRFNNNPGTVWPRHGSFAQCSPTDFKNWRMGDMEDMPLWMVKKIMEAI